MKRLVVILAMLLLAGWVHAGEFIEWESLPELPPASGQTVQPGVAGPFSGVHKDALIVAGGANFPDGLPWSKLDDGSSPKKIYHTDVYVLRKSGDDLVWSLADLKLPHGFSYGVSISTEKGVLCIGGEWREYDESGVKKFKSDKVFLLVHDGAGGVTMQDDFPALPVKCSDMSGARVGTKVYVAGGHDGQSQTTHFWMLDLAADTLAWTQLTSWPGPARSHSIAAAQNNGVDDCFYLFSGRSKNAEGQWQFLTDAYCYNPAARGGGSWTSLADIGTRVSGGTPVCVMAASGIQVGAHHIAIFGGASGALFRRVEQDIPREVAQLRAAGKTAEADVLEAERWALYTDHPGFSRDILMYHTITDSWQPMGSVPGADSAVGSHVTVTAVKWGDQIVVASGEVRPGVRSAAVWAGKPTLQSSFGWINYAVLGVYLGALVLMGFAFSRGETSTNDFFKAGGRIPWWAAGLSIFGTMLSAITFMAMPAKSYATNWSMLVFNIMIVVIAPLVVYWILPFYRRLNMTTAYEYIEQRFDVWVRWIASSFFIVFQFARIGIVLYLPAIALSIVTGFSIHSCILLMGVLSILYTALGGMTAVIWTDVLQVFVLLGGALYVLVVIPGQVSGGLSGAVTMALDADKLSLFDFHFSLKSPTFWVLAFGGLGNHLIAYGSDQAVIQRYLTTSSEKEAARGIWLAAAMVIPATLIFLALGSALFVFYQSNPAELAPAMQKPDAIFPWYIVTQLPAGVKGLLIAGVFAAAMSSLDSSMNSVATAFTTDFYRRIKSGASDRQCLNVARWITVVVGSLAICLALGMATWEIKSLWDEVIKYVGFFAGGLGGLFLLGMFTRTAKARGALIGLVLSAVLQFVLKEYNLVNGLLFAATGSCSCFVLGYLASVCAPGARKNIDGLTVYTLNLLEKPK